MPEAVIVSTARSPIGRAVKGSLKDMRPDDLSVQMLQAALAKVPGLDPRDITDLHLGVGQKPRSRPMSSFMISLEPAQILLTRASRHARATRYSFMKP